MNSFALKVKDGKVGEGIPFERVRRITGYLVGDLSRFNKGKLSEVKDRRSHNVTQRIH